MKTTLSHRGLRLPAAAVLVGTLTAAGCTLQKQEAPAFNGPSEFALALSMSATPDLLTRDGSSQSIVTITARDPQGNPSAGQRIIVGVDSSTPPGTTLSAGDVTTDGNGRATFAVMAPPATTSGDRITISLTPLGANFDNAVSRTFTIAVTPSNPSAPTPLIDISPSSPNPGATVRFDGGRSTDEGVVCGANCSYRWTFADGDTATGVVATRAFSTPGEQRVSLAVTDAGGAVGTTSQSFTVATPTAPVAGTITYGPTPVTVNSTINFDAGAATVGSGATITTYSWSWGDGSSGTDATTAQAQHVFTATGVYTVRLTVRDSLGRTATSTVVVTVT